MRRIVNLKALALVAVCLASAIAAQAQGSYAVANPVAVNASGVPLALVTVAICTANPGIVTTGCAGTLATTYTDVTDAHACSGTPGTQPLNNSLAPTVTSGCSNPGLTDYVGNVLVYSTPGSAYFCQYYGPTIATTVVPCYFPLSGSGAFTLTTVVPYSATPAFPVTTQNQLFTITLSANAVASLSVVGVTPPSYITFQITQDSAGAHTFTWPANVVGGAPIGSTANQVTTQQFVWNGTNATAIGPAITGSGPALSAGAVSAASLGVTGLSTFGNTATFSVPASFTATQTFPGIIDSAIGAGTSPICPNGVAGAFTAGGCTAGVALSLKNVTQTTHTGTTSLDTIYTLSVPANAMGATGRVRITLVFNLNVCGGASNTLRVTFGGTTLGGTTNIACSIGTTNQIKVVIEGGNTNATNTQLWDGLLFANTQSVANFTESTTGAVDTTAIVPILVKWQSAANSDSQTFDFVTVEFF